MEQAEYAIEALGGELILQQEFTLPDGDGRTILIIEKVMPTPNKYPRQGVRIVKSPLTK